jgi:two-component system alkaline phosphatase synthesis response regulator PhoP
MAKKKILVVDDEPQFIEMISMRLRSKDYDVIMAFDGRQALERIGNDNPDAVLLDILMPKMDGITVLKKIKNKHPQLPVFIITAFADKKRFQQAERFGASGFIVKTSDLKEEIERIASVLNIASRYRKNEA